MSHPTARLRLGVASPFFSTVVLLTLCQCVFVYDPEAESDSGGGSSGSGGSVAGAGGGDLGGQGGSGGNGGGAAGRGGAGGGGSGGVGGAGGGPQGGRGGSAGGGAGGGTGGSAGSVGLLTIGGYHVSGPLRGYFFTVSDSTTAVNPGGSTVSPADFSTNGRICVSGTAARVVNEEYAKTWGVILGWNVNQAVMPPNPPVATSLSGTFRIVLSGNVPVGARFKVAVGGVDHCAPISVGTNVLPMSALRKECWIAGGAPYAGQPVTDVGIHVSTNPVSSTPFNFCVIALDYTSAGQ